MLELDNAVRNGNLDLVNSLINEGVNVNKTNQFGETPLITACSFGHGEIAKLLIVNNADIHAADNDGLTALHKACSNGNIEIIRMLLAQGANINAVTRLAGSTPLHCACLGSTPDFKSNIEVSKLLIKKGADVNAINNTKAKPLALAHGNIELTKLLIPHMLLQEPTQKKPGFLDKNQELSAYWDKQLEKINYFPQEELIASKTLTKTILDKLSPWNDSLLSLSFLCFFKSLNPEAIKNQVTNETNQSVMNTTLHHKLC